MGEVPCWSQVERLPLVLAYYWTASSLRSRRLSRATPSPMSIPMALCAAECQGSISSTSPNEILDTRNLRKLQDWVYANCRTVPAAAAVPPAIIALAEMIDAHQSLRLVDGPARAPPPFSTPPPMTTAPEGWIPVVAA